MQKVTLTQVFRETKFSEKKGKNYTSIKIKAREFGDEWLSGFGNSANEQWKEGMEVEIEPKQNGKYLNFDTPQVRKPSATWDKINEHESRILKLEEGLKTFKQYLMQSKEMPSETLESQPTKDDLDLPF